MSDPIKILLLFQAEDGIRDLVRSRGLGDVYKRQRDQQRQQDRSAREDRGIDGRHRPVRSVIQITVVTCLLYTSDAADQRSSVDLGGRRIIKKKKR